MSPFLPPLVWRGRGAYPRPTAPEVDALTTRLSGSVVDALCQILIDFSDFLLCVHNKQLRSGLSFIQFTISWEGYQPVAVAQVVEHPLGELEVARLIPPHIVIISDYEPCHTYLNNFPFFLEIYTMQVSN